MCAGVVAANGILTGTHRANRRAPKTHEMITTTAASIVQVTDSPSTAADKIGRAHV